MIGPFDASSKSRRMCSLAAIPTRKLHIFIVVGVPVTATTDVIEKQTADFQEANAPIVHPGTILLVDVMMRDSVPPVCEGTPSVIRKSQYAEGNY